MTPTDAKVPSPESTGGAGAGFEVTVGAIALARLLRGDRVPGLGLPVTRVLFQRRFEGAVLDDLLLEADDPRGGVRRIEHQIKRTLSPTPSDEDFAEIVRRCLTALEADGDAVVDGWRRFGITTAPTQPMKDFDRVCRVARSHDEPRDFFDLIRSTARRGVRDRMDALRATVVDALTDTSGDVSVPPDDATADQATWRVARMLSVWWLDAEPDGADVLNTLDRLGDVVTGDDDPADVFRVMIEAARSWALQAGSIGLGDLRTYLESEGGVRLDAAPARRRAFDVLSKASEPLLDPDAARIGRTFQLPRRALRQDAADAIAEHPVVVLGGVAGVGKSMLARLAAADLADDGATVVAISLARRAGTLAGLEAELDVRLADALAGAPIGDLRVLVIDGGEQALTDEGSLFSAVLAAVGASTAHGPSWHLALTSRDGAVDTLAGLVESAVGVAPHRLVVGELTDDEVDGVVAAFPSLAPLGRHPRTKALLLRRPYLVELLVRAVQQQALPDGVVGEEDLVDVVTERLIRRDDGGLAGRGAPDARADIYLALADAAIANALPARLDGSDAEARAGLASDDVIRRTRASWGFAHDVLTDYAVATRLLEADGDEMLRGATAPRRLLRSVRLRMQRQIADGAAAGRLGDAWANLVKDAEALASDGPRWHDVPWEAVLHVGQARAVLDALTPMLLDHDGAGLVRLIDVTERLARRVVAGADDASKLVLDPALSGPVVDLVTALDDRMPDPCRLHAARLAHEHLDAAAALRISPDTALDRAAELPDALVGWAGDDEWGDVLEHTIGGIGLLGPHLHDRHDEFLARHARNRPHEVAEVVESPRTAAHLAVTRPDLLLRLAGLYYLGTGLGLDGPTGEVGRRPRPTHSYRSPFDRDDGFDDLEEGVRDHDHKQSRRLPMFPLGNNQSNTVLGPFAALLDGAPAHALRLIGSVVDAATAYRARMEFDDQIDDHEIKLDLDPGANAGTRRFTGPETVWRWYRRTGVGPGPALSALMALRAWGVARIRRGDAPSAIRDEILAAGGSLAFPAVALSVLVDGIDRVGDELDMFVVHPVVWRMETARVVGEGHGTALDVPDALRLRWPMSNVAMDLVLRADEEGRARLRALGQALRANHTELGTADSELLTQRWSAELNIDRYVAERHEDGLAVRVDYDPGVVDQLTATGGQQALDSLKVTGLLMSGVALRDGQEPRAGAAGHWREVVAAIESLDRDAFGMHPPGEVAAAAAAAVVMAACTGESVDDDDLHDAVEVLLDAARYFGGLAPPPRDPTPDDSEGDADSWPGRPVFETAWEFGADRSVASALPLLLRPDLAARASVELDDVAAAVEAIATSPYYETRARLARALEPTWVMSCAENAASHEAALAAARRLIATSGYGALDKRGHGYPPATLAEPFEDALAATSGDPVLDIATASFAIPVLATAELSDCEHGRLARSLLDALITYDEQVWPRDYARHGYHNARLWRRAVDGVIAERILRGDTDALERRLETFAHVAEELHVLLTLLAERASTVERAEHLHDAWPLVLDRLLPAARDLSPRPGDKREPYHRDVDELDRALVLIPTEGQEDFWPVQTTFQLGARWLGAFEGHPAVADRAIRFIGRMIGLGNDVAIQMVLRVLGDNVAAIRRESQMVTAFLQVVLQAPPPGPGANAARALLDRLAASGDKWALSVQQALEA